MPLINIPKVKVEPVYVLSNYEKLALEIIPEEQLRSTNHDERLIDMMIEEEARDASPEKTRQDIYKGLERRDVARVLAASKNLTVAEKQKIVQGIYNYLLNKKELSNEDMKRLIVLKSDPNISLIDLCIKLYNIKIINTK